MGSTAAFSGLQSQGPVCSSENHSCLLLDSWGSRYNRHSMLLLFFQNPGSQDTVVHVVISSTVSQTLMCRQSENLV